MEVGHLIEALLIAAISGGVSGLISWGGLRVELKWIHANQARQENEITGLFARVRELEMKRH